MPAALPEPVVRARLQLMLRESYLAAAVARLPVVDATAFAWCRTMATDGYYVYVDTGFCASLDEDELMFVFAHEVLHCVLGHIDRRGERDRERWNWAIDYATNALLVEAGMKMPQLGLYSRDYHGMTAEEIYDRLAFQSLPIVGGSSAGRKGTAGQKQGIPRERPFPADEHIEPTDPYGEALRAAEYPSEEERRQLRRELAASLRSALPGREAGNFAEEIRIATTPRVQWQHVLARFIGGLRRTDYRLYPFNRKHIWRDLYLPSLGVPGPEHLVVAVDTSGSMTSEVLAQVLAEIDRLRSVTECTLSVLECDVVIHCVTVVGPFERSSLSGPTYSFRGRGGTNLCPPFQWVREELRSGRHPAPEALIYMTDGYGPMPEKEPGVPVLWIVPEHGVKEVPFGTMLRM
jgi:predicted metal-dependent peptidase